MFLMNPRIETAYNGFLGIKRAFFSSLDMLRKDAPPSQVMEYMERGDSVSVLVQQGKDFIVLKQFRIGNFIREDETSVYSNVAGMVDSGETASEAAIRELKEELGVEPCYIEELGTYYPSAGGTTERMTFFFAKISEDAVPNPQEKEIHDWSKISEKEYRRLVTSGEMKSMQSVTAFLLAEEKWCF